MWMENKCLHYKALRFGVYLLFPDNWLLQKLIPKSKGHIKTLNCVALALGICTEKTVIGVWKNSNSEYAWQNNFGGKWYM